MHNKRLNFGPTGPDPNQNKVERILRQTWKWFKYIFYGETTMGHLFRLYVYVVLIGTILLMSPLCTNSTIWNFTNGLFTASSAFSDTGLVVKTTSEGFNLAGKIIIVLLIQFGGIGLYSVKIALFMIIGRKIGYFDREITSLERGWSKIGGTVDLIKTALIVIFLTEFVGGVAMFFDVFFFAHNDPTIANLYHNGGNSVWFAIFHSISATNNAGFDNIGQQSFKPFDADYFIQFVVIIEFIIGGIGFPVFYDLKEKISAKIHHRFHPFSLFTKITVTMYLIVAVIGLGCILLIEYVPSHAPPAAEGHLTGNGFNYFMKIFFNTMSTRNAGFSTTDMRDFHTGSQFIMSIMMWIGSSPASTGGGIRTTTLAVVIATTWAVARKRRHVNMMHRQVDGLLVRQALAVLGTSFGIVLLGSLVLAVESQINQFEQLTFIQCFFTCCSAFGTTGLSLLSKTGGETELGVVSKYVLIALMFIGQYGVSNTLFTISNKGKKLKTQKGVSYPVSGLTIG